MRLEIELDNGEIQDIEDADKIMIEIDHTERGVNSKGVVTLKNLNFRKISADIINRDIANALADGGRSIWEGTPFKIRLIEGSESIILFNGFVDKSSGQTEFSCDLVKAEIRESGSKTWLEEDRAGGFGFDLLFEKGLITKNDFIFIPSEDNTVPDVDQLRILRATFFMSAVEIARIVKDFADLLVETAGVFTTIPALIKLGFMIFYLIISLARILSLFIDMVQATFQPVKYQAAMKLETLLKKGAEYIGMEFISSKFDDPFWKQVVIMPEKPTQMKSIGIGSLDILQFISGSLRPLDNKQKGFYNGTYKALMLEVTKLWNAKTIVKDGVIRMERRDFGVQAHDVKLPDLEMKGQGTNARQRKATKIFRFASDSLETNTVDNLKGTILSVTTTIKSVDNPENVISKGADRVDINLSLATEKKTLTGPQIYFNEILKTIQKIASKLKVPLPDLSSLIEARKGILLLSDGTSGVPKIFAISEGSTPTTTKIHKDNRERLSAKGIYNESYTIDSFVVSPDNPNGNHFRFRDVPKHNMCFNDIKSVIVNPSIFKGETEVFIETASIQATTGLVEQMRIKENEVFDKQLEEILYEADGL